MYYNKLMKQLLWNDVKWLQLKAKMNNLRTKYVEMKNWLDKTGQGVDSGTIEEYNKKKCPFYNLLDGIYGGKANINVPYHYDSIQTHQMENGNQPTKVVDVQRNADVEQQSNVDDENVHRSAVAEEQSNVDDVQVAAQGNEVFVVSSNITDDEVEVLPIIDLGYLGSLLSDDGSQETSSQDNMSSVADETHHSLPESLDPDLRRSVPSTEQTNLHSIDEGMAFALFATDPSQREAECESEREAEREAEKGNNDSRIARYKKQLSECPTGRQSQPHKRDIPSNAAAFISDANLKRADTLHERNKIEMRHVENENMEVTLNKERFELDKKFYEEQLRFNNKELILKKSELQAKFDLRQQNFELICKKFELKEKERQDELKIKVLEMEKSERLETMKIEYDFKLQLELAKMKDTNKS